MIRALAVITSLAASSAAAQDQQQLYGSCFAAAYDAAHLAAHPGQRIDAVSVSFQGFEGSLLASVSYRLRYGTRFGFSGECAPEDSGYLCKACGTGDCASDGQTFRIRWSGGDTLDLINDTTGLFAANPAGGRDRVGPGGEHGLFRLKRASTSDCSG